MKKSNSKKTPSGNVFEIVFKKNGDLITDMEPPPIRDVALSPESIDLIEEVITSASSLPQRIKNEGDKELYVDKIHELRKTKKELETFQADRRTPWTRITQMISMACEPPLSKLSMLLGRLSSDVASWEQMVRDGIERQRVALERKAAEKLEQSKYTDNPETKRHAKNQAESLKEEAKKFAPEKHTTVGVAFQTRWEPEIADPIALLRKYPEFADLSLHHQVIQKAIRQLEEQGVEITAHTFGPALHLRKESRVSIR